MIIPGTYIAQPRYEGTLPDDLAEALATIRPGTRIASICTGAFVLGAAGLLDDRPATTHWERAELFRSVYPQVQLDEDRLFIDDGDILTSAGLAAGVDLCLHLIRRDFGSEVANRAARHCVVPPWRDGGQSQFIERVVPEEGSEGTAPTRAWALERLGRELSLPAMAAQAQMSVRTFSRRFKAETGQSPGTWLLQQRVAPRVPPAGDDRPVRRPRRRVGRPRYRCFAASSPPFRARGLSPHLPQDLPRGLSLRARPARAAGCSSTRRRPR